MNLCVSVLLIVYLSGNIVWSYEYSDQRSRNLFVSPSRDLADECSYNVVIVSEFRFAISEFTSKIYKRVGIESNNHFTLSPLSMWLSLAAIAEGSAGDARQELFQLLNLPEDKCVRQQYYSIANSHEYPNNDVTMSKKRLLVIDQNISLNKQWEYFVRKNRLIDIIAMPLRKNPNQSIDTIRQITSTKLPNIDLNGNALLLDTLDYKYISNTAFSSGKVVRVPFYNDFGEMIGNVNIIKMKKRVKLAYLPDLNLKVLELSDNYNSQYRLLYGIAHGNNSSIEDTIKNFNSDIILKVLRNLRLSRIPLDIGIPQYSATTEIDVKAILENFGVKTLWTDVWATRNISNPPIFPSGFIQRVTVTFDGPVLRTLVEETSNFVPAINNNLRNEDTGLDDAIGRDFIVDRPFIVGLFDAETYTCLFTSTISELGAV